MDNKFLVLLAQLNPIVGDIKNNKNKAIESIKYAIENKVNLVVFPKNFLLGNPIGKILDRYPYIINQLNKAIDEIKSCCKNISVLINSNNETFYIENGSIKKNDKFEIAFFEDLKNLKTSKNIIICMDSTPSRAKQEYFRNSLLKNTAIKNNSKLIYVNQTGASEEYVYDGLSRIYNNKGEIISISKEFGEELKIADIFSNEKINYQEIKIEDNFSLDYEYDLKRTYNSIKYAIQEYFSKNGFKRAVLGLSGGLDSTICAVLLADALGKENVLGVSMPSKYTSSDSKNDGYKLAQNLGIHYIEVPIKDIHDTLSEKFEDIFKNINWCERCEKSYTQDNIQARTRATILWGISNEYPKTLPIATSDKSESYMGYATVNGDMSGGYAPICDVTKTKLFALARWLNKNREEKNAIPQNIIEKPPGAELAINPETGKTLTAEEALMPYEFLDEVIWRIENKHQSFNDMLSETFLYEKKNSLTKDKKTIWLEKFFKRMKSAMYKWYIIPPGPVVDSYSINKIEYKQSIVSNINYKEN